MRDTYSWVASGVATLQGLALLQVGLRDCSDMLIHVPKLFGNEALPWRMRTECLVHVEGTRV